MKIQTTRFGEIEIKPEDIINFPDGILGFPNDHEYVPIDEERATPFRMLQSTTVPQRAFIILDPRFSYPDYIFDVTFEDVVKFHCQNTDDLEVYAIVEIGGQTLNLQGPVVIDKNTKIGYQFILTDKRYTTREPIIPG